MISLLLAIHVVKLSPSHSLYMIKYWLHSVDCIQIAPSFDSFELVKMSHFIRSSSEFVSIENPQNSQWNSHETLAQVMSAWNMTQGAGCLLEDCLPVSPTSARRCDIQFVARWLYVTELCPFRSTESLPYPPSSTDTYRRHQWADSDLIGSSSSDQLGIWHAADSCDGICTVGCYDEMLNQYTGSILVD